MKDFGNTIYAFSCVVAATVLGIGVADYWFGHHELTALLSWAVLTAIPWLVVRTSLFVLASLEAGRPHWIKVKNPNAPAVKREAEEEWDVRAKARG
jgi:hypothetical protein